MNFKNTGRALLLLSILSVSFKPPVEKLFNGKDFSGWDKYLDIPNQHSQFPQLKKDANEKYTEPLGYNNDPAHVFSVVQVDGEPAIRVSGEVFGGIISQKEYQNYHLQLQFKWGTKKWPPRDTVVRDSGILYHSQGEIGKVPNSWSWLPSQECQIQEGDCGDYWAVGNARVKINAVRRGDKYVYDPSGPEILFGYGTEGKPRCFKRMTSEKSLGEWNQVDLYILGGQAVHVLNGQTVLVVNASYMHEGDRDKTVDKGKIQLQSEGAEIFYRRITLEPLTTIPEAVIPH
jgi:hypothetical protein